ncbi:MAG TPA: hypothetical protein VHE30_26995 [Polyangiaceae bacterium]|nr:hypothetical protein [Polyangiaceae bacterium]
MAWRNLFVVGLVGATVAVGCTVNTTNNGVSPLSDGGETGGSANTGGSSGAGTGGASGGGGAATGGASGGGGAATGGASTGGEGGGGNVCEVADGGDGECSTCIKHTCCSYYSACVAAAPCGATATDDGEFIKFLTCMQGQFADAGSVNAEVCSGQAAADGITLDFATQDLINCIRGFDAGTQPCSDKCFGTAF